MDLFVIILILVLDFYLTKIFVDKLLKLSAETKEQQLRKRGIFFLVFTVLFIVAFALVYLRYYFVR